MPYPTWVLTWVGTRHAGRGHPAQPFLVPAFSSALEIPRPPVLIKDLSPSSSRPRAPEAKEQLLWISPLPGIPRGCILCVSGPALQAYNIFQGRQDSHRRYYGNAFVVSQTRMIIKQVRAPFYLLLPLSVSFDSIISFDPQNLLSEDRQMGVSTLPTQSFS